MIRDSLDEDESRRVMACEARRGRHCRQALTPLLNSLLRGKKEKSLLLAGIR